jgi:hypothetical protein
VSLLQMLLPLLLQGGLLLLAWLCLWLVRDVTGGALLWLCWARW